MCSFLLKYPTLSAILHQFFSIYHGYYPQTFSFCLGFCGCIFRHYCLAIQKRPPNAPTILSGFNLGYTWNYTFNFPVYLFEKQTYIILN